ncbi:hypothetical protein [uncultured Hymenobacter sp.]|uniref:hypothetical protein n=1 Tax=uncultured Hymenobacter sp. TaxID=170016 RepID=UPI0035C98F5C
MSAATHLLGEPQDATAALETTLTNCPRPTHFGEYKFSTPTQRSQLDKLLASHYLLPFEHKWVNWMRVRFDVATADTVLQLLERIIAYRQATGIAPVYRERGYYWPEAADSASADPVTPPAPQPPSRP